MTVFGGIVGTILGGIVADMVKKKVKNPYFKTSSISLIPAVLVTVIILFIDK